MAAQRFVNTLPKANGTAGGADTVSTTIGAGLADRIVGSVFCDKDGVLSIQQSGDGQNWDINTTYNITANNGNGFSEEALLAYAQVTFHNTTASDATVFRLYVKTTSSGVR